jgi:alkylated DNA repair protein alkB family protein 6
VHYIPEFINGEQHEYLMNSVYENGSRFNSLVHAKRRVQKYGGDVNSLGLENIEKLPPFVEHLKQVLETQQIIDKPINHALINEYERGTGIMAHTDGPLYYPVVTIVSLGTPCLFKFSPMGEQHYQVILFVEPRSLLTFRGAAYREWTHGIDYYDEDTILFDFDGTHIVRSNALNFAGSKWGKLAESKLQEMP